MGAQKPKLREKLTRWTRLHQFLHDQHGVRYFVMAITLVIAAGLSVLGFLWIQPKAQPAVDYPAAVKKKEAIKYYSPLTGVQVADEATTRHPVTAIMIENSPDARPQSGLKDAGVVFEAVAEGGITRFVALYQESRPALIGPVRSVRPYYVEWAAGFDPAMAHIGGSARALTMIRSGNYGLDLDQFFNAGTYWRATDRAAPHNVYTSFDKLDALEAAKGKTTSKFTFSPRQDDKKSDAPNATSIDIAVSTGYYAVHYNYEASSNSYIRQEGGANHVDREGGQLTPKVVIAMKVPMTLGFEDGYREQITTLGSGEADIFQNGTVTKGTWTKGNVGDRLVFTDVNGQEIPLNRGQTWITALASDRSVSWQ